MSLLARILTLARGGMGLHGARELNGFVDTLLQKFEDSRPGLPDDAVRAGAQGGAERAERYFLELYQGEVERLLDTIRAQSPHLSPAAMKRFLSEVDEHVRRVVVPAYVRLARRFTARERNDFFIAAEEAHVLERLGLGAAGLALGAFIVFTPFIPLNEKWMVAPFIVAGLLFPEVRRVLAIRRYSGELHALVARADREIARLDVAYLTSRRERGDLGGDVGTLDAELASEDGGGTASAAPPGRTTAAKPKGGS